MFMVLSSWQSHCESSPGSFDECRTAPSGRRPKTMPDDLGCESACTGCQKLHPPSPFIIITQPESWYSFYRPTEGRRLSRPIAGWLHTEMVYPSTDGHPSSYWRSTNCSDTDICQPISFEGKWHCSSRCSLCDADVSTVQVPSVHQARKARRAGEGSKATSVLQ